MDAVTSERPPTTLAGDLRHLPSALAPLTAERRWVVWRWAWLPDWERWTKVPYQPHKPAAKARSNDPSTWGAYETALALVEAGEADGIGFILHDSDIAAFDIDDCRDPQTGDIAPWAWTLIDAAASYTEVTVSGAGVRIIGQPRAATCSAISPIRARTGGWRRTVAQRATSSSPALS